MLLTPLLSALRIIIDYFFSIFTYMVLLRLLAQMMQVDFYNPVIQLIVRATNPILIPLRRIIPSLSKFDIASLVLAMALILIEIFLLKSIYDGEWAVEFLLSPENYIILFSKLVSMILKLLIAIVIIRTMMSWLQPYERHPATILLTQLTEPMLAPIRRLLPLNGIDLSPMALIIFLYMIDEITAGYLRMFFEVVS